MWICVTNAFTPLTMMFNIVKVMVTRMSQMKIKVSKATNIQLDWLVAKCKGTVKNMLCGHGDISYTPYLSAPSIREYWRPSENWAQGGPIIERENISSHRNIANIETSPGVWELTPTHWTAQMDYSLKFMAYTYSATGPTLLIAAMRSYVTSKLGEEVEVPDDL